MLLFSKANTDQKLTLLFLWQILLIVGLNLVKLSYLKLILLNKYPFFVGHSP